MMPSGCASSAAKTCAINQPIIRQAMDPMEMQRLATDLPERAWDHAVEHRVARRELGSDGAE